MHSPDASAAYEPVLSTALVALPLSLSNSPSAAVVLQCISATPTGMRAYLACGPDSGVNPISAAVVAALCSLPPAVSHATALMAAAANISTTLTGCASLVAAASEGGRLAEVVAVLKGAGGVGSERVGVEAATLVQNLARDPIAHAALAAAGSGVTAAVAARLAAPRVAMQVAAAGALCNLTPLPTAPTAAAAAKPPPPTPSGAAAAARRRAVAAVIAAAAVLDVLLEAEGGAPRPLEALAAAVAADASDVEW